MFTPRLEIFPDRIMSNASAVMSLCQSHHVDVACVTKVTSAHPAVVKAFVDAGATMLADSRLENLKAIREMGITLPLMLLRLPTPSRAAETVALSDISLVSSFETMTALSKAAHSKRHRVVLMIDVGDLREGVWPDRALDLLKKAKELSGIEIVGLGCNLACFGGVIPTADNTNTLISIRNEAQKTLGLTLPILSGGNSSGLPLLASGQLPSGINHYRIGEAIVLGRNVIDRSPWPKTRQDTFVVTAEVLEIYTKASVPIGDRGQDAFGGNEEFPERGNRKRAIVNVGRQDVAITGLDPIEKGIHILGGSSDHLILDVEDMRHELQVGHTLRFYPNYGALLALSTSPYVQKMVCRG